jgi:hypothetical protein
MRRFLLVIIILFCSNILLGQLNDAFKNEINHIFEHVDRSFVTTGYLEDYGINFTDVANYNGVLSDTNYIDYREWETLYLSLFSFQFNSFGNFPFPVDVYDQVLTEIEQKNLDSLGIPVNVLAGLHWRYEKFKEDAVSSNLVQIYNNQIYDVQGRSSSPYEIKDAFAVVPYNSRLFGASHYFTFPSALFYSNTGFSIQSIQVDFGNGNGFQFISTGEMVPVSYSTNGEKIIHVRINYSNNTFKESRTKIEVYGIKGGMFLARHTSADAEFRFPRNGFKSPKAYLGEVAGANVAVRYGNADNVIKKPLIIVEGFDPWHIITPAIRRTQDRSNNFDFDDLISDVTGGLDWPINFTHGNTTYTTLLDAIEGEGFDLIFVDYNNGVDYIQRNAYLVANIIEWVNSVKQPDNGIVHKNVVMGFSMGGLVARYALRDMELDSIDHETRLYISFDSPHQGANVPVGFQAMVRHLNNSGFGLGLPGIYYRPEQFTLGNFIPDIGRAFRLLESPASKQMLRYRVNGGGDYLTYNNHDFDAFMIDYHSHGYPREGDIRNVVLANGSECGTDQGFPPYAEFVNATELENINLNVWGTLGVNIISPMAVFTPYPQLAI